MLRERYPHGRHRRTLPRITGAEWLLARTSTHPTILRLFSDYSKTILRIQRIILLYWQMGWGRDPYVQVGAVGG